MMNLLTLGQSSLPMKAIEIEREYPTTKVKIRPSTSGSERGALIGMTLGARAYGVQGAAVGLVVGGVVGACVGPED
ncbi:hypothetical protein [Vibrio splendidus]|uniref:hypothetical protein n=1 Tax=Vibrio splendidus TaxID=29497 RepID=UPI000066FCF2|nr:hypothetical protein [Vibrio splendidus]EAP94233.1 hypothetical protein V12B01_07653 [Vibrio splendidus 12B01]OCH64333.1 hypothetical protein A6D94_13110 [Vibrio splendidus]PMI48858.1 hypothetical protein BCU42_16835 [Vibrio splendidus]PMP52624.1 hypothetical protein BCS85_04605 [Vibrio splendidus]